jgi:hypothetical protein
MAHPLYTGLTLRRRLDVLFRNTQKMKNMGLRSKYEETLEYIGTATTVSVTG